MPNLNKHTQKLSLNLKPTLNFKNCSYACAYHCVPLSYTTQHRTVLIIFPLIRQTIIITQMMSAGAVAKYCDEHACVCACESVWLSASMSPETRNHTRDLYQFFCACCLWLWLGPPPAGWRNSPGRGNFFGRGLSGSVKMIDNIRCSRVRCKRDHLIANNVMQQKGSFSMPGKRKSDSGIFWAQAMRPIGCEEVIGV